MKRKGCLPGYATLFDKDAVDKLIELARDLNPEPYLYWKIGIPDHKEWQRWLVRRCDWIDGRPPLDLLVKKAWADGVDLAIKALGEQKTGWQAVSWKLERFDPQRFGRFARWSEPPQTPDTKKPNKLAEKASKKLEKTSYQTILKIRDAIQ